MEEIWKDIKGYEGLYQVSSEGRVKSKARNGNWKEKILKPVKTKDNYFIVGLCKNGKSKNKRINRLVAEAFIPNPENKPEVNHIDGNKHNNKISNLEWVTTKENIVHAYKIGLNSKEKNVSSLKEYAKRGCENPKSKRVYQFDLNGNLIAIYVSVREAERQTKIKSQMISSCCLNKINHVGKYVWRYKEMM